MPWGGSPCCPQLCRVSHPFLPPFLWLLGFLPLCGPGSGLLCIPATAHTEGHIYNANVRLAQENRVHPTHPCVCRVILAGTPPCPPAPTLWGAGTPGTLGTAHSLSLALLPIRARQSRGIFSSPLIISVTPQQICLDLGGSLA